jgi:hypothetical protein
MTLGAELRHNSREQKARVGLRRGEPRDVKEGGAPPV